MNDGSVSMIEMYAHLIHNAPKQCGNHCTDHPYLRTKIRTITKHPKNRQFPVFHSCTLPHCLNSSQLCVEIMIHLMNTTQAKLQSQTPLEMTPCSTIPHTPPPSHKPLPLLAPCTDLHCPPSPLKAAQKQVRQWSHHNLEPETLQPTNLQTQTIPLHCNRLR